MDPTGECSTDENGINSGICATTREAVDLVNNQLADPSSNVSNVEAEAVANGRLIEVRTGDKGLGGKKVDGGTTETITTPDHREVAVVTIDTSDAVTMSGADATTGAAAKHTLSIEEVVEHEVGGHGADFAGGGLQGMRNAGETTAIAAENGFRERHGNSFRRTDKSRILKIRKRPKQ